MSRLADDITLLERAAMVANAAIYQEDKVSVSAKTLDILGDEVAARRLQPTEYMLIRDEAVWLLQAAKNLVIYRDDGLAPLVERWKRLGEMLASGVALDLVNAKKSMGAL